MATTEGFLERIVQHRCSHVEVGPHRRPVPAHLLLLVHAFGDDLVDRALHERGRDRFAIPAPGCVMDQRSLVPLEVGQQLADVVFQAPDASHAAYRCTPCQAAERRGFAPASRPTPMPKAPLRTLQSANGLGGQVGVSQAKAASGLQCVFEAHGGVPQIQQDCGIRQRLAFEAPQSDIAISQHCRRSVRGRTGHCERLLERAGCNRGAAAGESEAGPAALSADHLASDHFKNAARPPGAGRGHSRYQGQQRRVRPAAASPASPLS
jgi:hypothetical protein